jgi:hypothetical protein
MRHCCLKALLLSGALAPPAVAWADSPGALPRTVPVYGELTQASDGDREVVFDAATSLPVSVTADDGQPIEKDGKTAQVPSYSAKGNDYLQSHPELMKVATEPPAKSPAPGWLTGLGVGLAAGGAGLIGAAAVAAHLGGSLLGLAPALAACLGLLPLVAGIGILIFLATS